MSLDLAVSRWISRCLLALVISSPIFSSLISFAAADPTRSCRQHGTSENSFHQSFISGELSVTFRSLVEYDSKIAACVYTYVVENTGTLPILVNWATIDRIAEGALNGLVLMFLEPGERKQFHLANSAPSSPTSQKATIFSLANTPVVVSGEMTDGFFTSDGALWHHRIGGSVVVHYPTGYVHSDPSSTAPD